MAGNWDLRATKIISIISESTQFIAYHVLDDLLELVGNLGAAHGSSAPGHEHGAGSAHSSSGSNHLC